jgi:hypothetical protein
VLEKTFELAVGFWTILLNIASWLLAGSWYEIMFKLLGATGSLFLIRQIHFELSESSNTVFALTVTVLTVATLFWLLLAAAVVYVAFFS